jgi:hypothetical protein
MKVYDLVSDKDYKPVETFQDVFNTIVNHLIFQNKTSSDYGSGCRYRAYSENEEINKCAVGCLISDINYHEIIEDSLASNPEVINAIKKSNPNLIIDDKMKELFLLMQFVHDQLEPENWIYMSFLVWRDMNRFISHRVNNDYENIQDFPYINDYDEQKVLYKYAARAMALADVEKRKEHKGTMRDVYLDQLKSDNPKSPIEFFREYQITFISLIK